jgi:hypothetical protein
MSSSTSIPHSINPNAMMSTPTAAGTMPHIMTTSNSHIQTAGGMSTNINSSAQNVGPTNIATLPPHQQEQLSLSLLRQQQDVNLFAQQLPSQLEQQQQQQIHQQQQALIMNQISNNNAFNNNDMKTSSNNNNSTSNESASLSMASSTAAMMSNPAQIQMVMASLMSGTPFPLPTSNHLGTTAAANLPINTTAVPTNSNHNHGINSNSFMAALGSNTPDMNTWILQQFQIPDPEPVSGQQQQQQQQQQQNQHHQTTSSTTPLEEQLFLFQQQHQRDQQQRPSLPSQQQQQQQQQPQNSEPAST